VNGEITYYDNPGAPLVNNIFDPPVLAPEPYGGQRRIFSPIPEWEAFNV
jgi:hypothetical protein